jgi:uncharacterized protein YegP (UPF0339 family)
MADRKTDEYQTLAFYKKHTKAKKFGFSKFDVDGDFYFCRYHDGKIVMLSQAYSAASGRDNGIVSVRKNEKITKRYRFDKRAGGKHGFGLMAGNGQEIAISPDMTSRKAAETVAGRLTGKIKATKGAKTSAAAAKPAKAKSKKATASTGRRGDYKPLAFYEKHGGKSAGFNTFEQGGESYFNYAQGGKVVLISEAYTSAAGRDNGIASVKKNMKLAERYDYKQHKNGKHFFDLKAGNHQEIATSRWYDSASAAKTGGKALQTGLAKPKPKKKTATKKKAAAAGVAAATVGGAAIAARKANVEQDYKPLKFYTRQTKGRAEGIESFTGDDGKHYFAHFENGKIALISEGYPTKAARDKGVASVRNNISNEKRYDYRTLKNGKYDYRLKAGNGEEIARSVWYGSAAAAAAGAAYLIGTRKRVPVAKPKAVAPAAVAAQPVSAKPVAPKPVAEIPPVAAAATASTPAPVEGGGIWGWLKWLLLGLLALLALLWLFSCMGGEKDAKTLTPAAAVTIVGCWDGSEAASLDACPTKVTCADGSFAATQAACPVVAPVMLTCWDGSKVESLATCPAEPVQMMTCWDGSQVENLSACPVEPAPVTVAAPTRMNAVMDADSLFDVCGDNSTRVSALGSNPQFGDSRGLSAAQFYAKLQSRHATSAQDRGFLEYLARQLGYDRFSDVPASAISETSVANGQTGVLGFGTEHAYQCSRMDLNNPTDLDAFRFAALNGREVYFMKRCGNFFHPNQ